MTTTITLPAQLEDVQPEANSLLAEVQALALVTQADADKAGTLCNSLKKFLKKIDARFEEILVPQRAAIEKTREMKREATAPVERVIDELTSRLRLWIDEQAKAAAAEAARAAEIARKAEEERVLSEAVALESAGEPHLAEILLDGPTEALAPVVAMPMVRPTVAGLSRRTYYSAKVKSLSALVKAVAEGKAPLQALVANQSFLNSQARAFKSGFSMPGVELVAEDDFAGSGRAAGR